MRPVERNAVPADAAWRTYRDAFPALVGRLGPFCSYCERKLPTNLAVEHILPKSVHPDESMEWDNFLLGCVNCNSAKNDHDVDPVTLLLPDRDNTFAAFAYAEDGEVSAAGTTVLPWYQGAIDLIDLVQLNRSQFNNLDDNERILAIDRPKQRKEAFLLAKRSLRNLNSNDTPGLRDQIAITARENGHFSIWMKVFAHDPDMLHRFIQEFEGTSPSCFAGLPATFTIVSPRPDNGLVGAGKV